MTLLFTEFRPDGFNAIGALSIDGDQTAEMLIEDGSNTAAPAVSPDGQWIAYDSDLSGQREVYVQRFPDLGDRQRISTNGGGVPRWGSDGSELFYMNPDGGQLIVVPIDEMGETFAAGTPESLFQSGLSFIFSNGRPYDPAPDGRRFVIIRSFGVGVDGQPQIILAQNWDQELNERVPVP